MNFALKMMDFVFQMMKLSKASPRTEVFADSEPFGVLLMNIDGKKWKVYNLSFK